MHHYDHARLERYLQRHIPGFTTLDAVERFGQGQSNPTYAIQSGKARYVLRAKPAGPILPSAHAVEREYTVIAALGETPVPVPSVFHLADETAPLGVPFYVMAHVEGEVFWDPSLPHQTPEARKTIYFAMCDVLADLHDVDIDAVGLSSFGRPSGYIQRQFDLWRRQYADSATHVRQDVAYLEAWLAEVLPQDDGAVGLVHGDYRIDNMIFGGDGQINAVLDWELSTLGHPMADLAYQCMMWRMPVSGHFKGLAGVDRGALGLPSDEDYISRYCTRRGIARPENWVAYVGFAAFRFLAILQGVLKRGIDGTAANPIGSDGMEAAISYLAADAAKLAKAAG